MEHRRGNISPVTSMNFEPLESRQLMSVSLSGSTLYVQGNYYNNNLSVAQSGSTLTVNDNGALSSYSSSASEQPTSCATCPRASSSICRAFWPKRWTLDGLP